MINLKIYQRESRFIAKLLGYKSDKKNALKALKREYKEFKKAVIVSYDLLETAINIENDTEFMQFFEDNLKNTVFDEIPDPINIMAGFCEHMGYDLESVLMVKKRYNAGRC